MAVRIVTDSASTLSDADIQRLSITTVPIHVTADGAELTEAELLAPGFAARLAEMTALPRTSQPAPEEFAEVFRTILDAGDEVAAVLISAGMSGTVQSAEVAAAEVRAERPDARIAVVDSRSNSLEEGYAVLAAAEAAFVGKPLEACVRAAVETTRRTRFLFTPRTLEYLRRGGRISGAAGLLGVILRIAPVLTAEKGATGVAGVARSGASAHRKIASLMRADVERHGLRRCNVQYFGDRAEADRFVAEVIQPITGEPVAVVPIHPVIALHVGPAVGVVYETERPLR